MTCTDINRRERGFTLVEVLIALANVAGMTAALVATAQADARTRGAVRQRREALMLAQSALDASYDANEPESGSWAQYTWRVSRNPAGLIDPLDQHPLERLSVSVSFQGSTVLRLGTLRARP